MTLKVSSNTAEDAAVTADQLVQGEIGKVVTVDNKVNAFSGALNCFIVCGSKYEADCAMVFTPGGPRIIRAEHLYLYRVVRMPSGFKLTLEVE